MKRVGIRAVPVSERGLAAGAFSGIDYADAYAVDLPPNANARSLAEAAFASAPRCVGGPLVSHCSPSTHLPRLPDHSTSRG